MGRMSGKTVVVTGAGTGVGQAAMVLFAREGARVLGVARTQANLERTLEQARAAGGEGSSIRAGTRCCRSISAPASTCAGICCRC